MDFKCVSSLLSLSSVSIVATLFYHEDVMYIIKRFMHRLGWCNVIDQVTKHASLLPIPPSMNEDVLGIVQPIGEEIRKWLCEHESMFRGHEKLNKSLSWTSLGTIDYMKTAKNVLDSGELDNLTAFRLACVHGLANDIHLLWPSVKDMLLSKDNHCLKRNKGYDDAHHRSVTLWVSHITGQTRKYLLANGHLDHTDFFTNAFQKAVENGNVSAAGFFITMLARDLKTEVVKNSTTYVLRHVRSRQFNTSMLLFLLTSMEKPLQYEILVNNSENTLIRFLEWPLQRFFMDLADMLWVHLPSTAFYSVVQAIVQRIMQSEKSSMYHTIFKQFWLKSPSHFRYSCITNLISPIVDCVFLPHNHKEVIQSLCNDLKAYEKLEVIFFKNEDSVLQLLLNENKGRVCKSLIQTYFPSDSLVSDFEERYNNYTRRYHNIYYGNFE